MPPRKKPPPRTPVGERTVIHIADSVERRRRERALEHLRHLADATEALSDEPDAHSNFTLLGNLRFLEGAFEDAIADYSCALSLTPENSNARRGRARCYVAIGEIDRALADFERALGFGPAPLENAVELRERTVEAYYEVLRILEERGDAAALLAMLDRALAAAPDELPLLVVRHDQRRRRGDAEGAEADRESLAALGFDPLAD